MAITMTERAAGQIKAIATQKELPNTPCLRVGVKGQQHQYREELSRSQLWISLKMDIC